MSEGSRARRWSRRLGLMLGGVLVGLLIGEAVGRLDGLVRGNDLVFMAPMGYPQDIYVQDGQMNYPNPHFKGTIQSFGYSVTPTFSSWATRGAEPQTGVQTWITVGDSFTIALQVKDEETFSARLAAAEGVQVLNSGVDGYSTWKEALRAVQLGRHFPPTVVIAAFFTGNDFFDNRSGASHTLANPGIGPGEPGAPEYKVPVAGVRMTAPWYTRFIRDHSVLAAHWWSWQETQRVRANRDPNARRFREELGLFTVEGQAKAANDRSTTEQALTFFKQAATELGARGVVAVMPPAFVMDADTALRTFHSVGLDKVTPDLDSAQSTAVAAAQRAGLEVCDMLPPLRQAAAAGERPYLPFDGHLTVHGHEIVAAALKLCVDAGTAR